MRGLASCWYLEPAAALTERDKIFDRSWQFVCHGSDLPAAGTAIRFDWAGRSSGGGYPPYPTPAALTWLVEQGLKLLGIDTPGLELPGNPALINHHLLFDHGIPPRR